VSLTEPGLEAAGRVNDLFGLGGTGYEVTRLFRDKLAMRRQLADLDPTAIAAAPLHERADLTDFGARHGYRGPASKACAAPGPTGSPRCTSCGTS
jgi:hypothetical protein